MGTSTTIRSLTVVDLDIPLTTPFGIASGAQDVARNLLITLELADGTHGYGEAAPFPAFNGETQAGARAAVEAARTTIEGADVREWRAIAAALRELVPMVGSAQCALETAVLDALTRQAALPLWAFFGGVSTSLETDMTIPTGSLDDAMVATMDILDRGISSIKVKIGADSVAADLDRLIAIHRIAPDAPLILDGNGGFSTDQAFDLLGALDVQQIRPALFEQPVQHDNWEGLRQLTQMSGTTIAADESVTNAGDALRVVFESAAHVVNIKLMKGGIVEALHIAHVCRSAGVGLMIGGMVESILAMTVSACFAAGIGGFRFVDLDTPLFLAENPFDGGFAQHGGHLDLTRIAAGHGVTPRS